jgi:hypothetical protein
MPLVTSYDLKDAVQEIKIKLSLLEEHLNHI